MELLQHIGLVYTESGIEDIYYKTKGLLIIVFLLWVLFLGHIISKICTLFNFFLPHSTNNLKRSGIVAFWDLCIYFMRLNKVNIKVSGDDLDGESAIVLCNHRSLADHLLVSILARYADPNKNRVQQNFNLLETNLTLPQVTFFSWFLNWRIPSPKIFINMAKCDENWELDTGLGNQFFTKLINSNLPEWIVVFPEVNIWTVTSSIIQQQQNEKFYLPVFQGLLYPRFSSFHNIVNAIHPGGTHKFSKIYDMTVIYESASDKAPSPQLAPSTEINPVNSMITDSREIYTPTLIDIFSSKSPITIRTHVRTRATVRVPIKRNKLEKYLEHLWVEKDKQLLLMQGSQAKRAK